MNVDTAFLNAPIDEDIWVQLPKGSRPEGEEDDGVDKLKKSLYGLKQAPREWNKCINEFLVSMVLLILKPIRVFTKELRKVLTIRINILLLLCMLMT